MYLKKVLRIAKIQLFFLVSSNTKALVKCFYIFSSCKELSNKSFHLEVPNGKKCVRRFKETQEFNLSTYNFIFETIKPACSYNSNDFHINR